MKGRVEQGRGCAVTTRSCAEESERHALDHRLIKTRTPAGKSIQTAGFHSALDSERRSINTVHKRPHDQAKTSRQTQTLTSLVSRIRFRIKTCSPGCSVIKPTVEVVNSNRASPLNFRSEAHLYKRNMIETGEKQRAAHSSLSRGKMVLPLQASSK